MLRKNIALLCLFIAPWCMARALADNGLELKKFFLDTPMGGDGRSACVIYAPAGEAYQAEAARLAGMLEKHCSFRPEIKTDDEQELWRGENRTLIVLGNPGVSRLLRQMEFRCLIRPQFKPKYYSEPLTFRLQTIHDPWGRGINVIMLGGVTAAETAMTFPALLDHMRKTAQGFVLPPVFFPVRSLSAEVVAKIEKKIETVDTMPFNYMAYNANEAGDGYLLYGDDLYARLYRASILRLAREKKYCHLYLFREVRYWNAIEESPVFSDDDRLRITQYFRDSVADEKEGIGNLASLMDKEMLSNHGTQKIAGILVAADYLRAYYPSAEHQRWYEQAQECFQRYATNFNTADEGVLQFAVVDNVFSALSYGQTDPASHQFLRRTLNRLIPEVNNTGFILPHGDDSPYEYQQPEWFATGARVYGDPGFYWMYLFMQNKGVDFKEGWLREGTTWWPVFMEPRMPDNFPGINTTACDEELFSSLRHWQRGNDIRGDEFASEHCFGKAAFRGGLSADDDYLQFDGRGLRDANSIVRYLTLGKTLLFTCEAWIQTAASDYNTVVVAVDGAAPNMSPLAEIIGSASLEHSGFFSSRVRNEHSADWTRNIIWLKNRFFVVFDQVDARRDGFFTVDSFWRVLGKKLADDNGLAVTQDGGVDFSVIPFGADRQMTATGRNPQTMSLFARDKWPIPYPASNAPKVVHLLIPHTACQLRQGEGIVNGACFWASAAKRPTTIKVQTITPDALRIAMNGALLLAVRGKAVFPELEIDADLALLGEDGISAFNARKVRLGDATVFNLEKPVSFEWSGGAMPQFFTGKIESGRWNEVVRKIIAGLPACESTRREVMLPAAGRLKIVRDLPGGSRVTCGWGEGTNAPAAGPVVIGRQDGKIEAFTLQLEPLWSFACSNMVNSIAAGDVDGDGKAEFCVGSDDCTLYLLDADGRLLRKWTSPFDYQKPGMAYGQWMWPKPYVKRVFLHDFNRDGKAEILAGCGGGTWLLDGEFHALWPLPGEGGMEFTATSALFADINGDGADELFAGADDMWHEDIVRLYDLKNKRQLAAFGVGYNGQTKSLALVDYPPRGKTLVLGSMNRGVMAGSDFTGNRQWHDSGWTFKTGDAVDMICEMNNKQGVICVVGGGFSRWLSALGGDGRKLWSLYLPAPPTVGRVFGNVLSVGCSDGTVLKIDANGTIVASIQLKSSPTALLAGGQNSIIAGNADGAITLITGE